MSRRLSVCTESCCIGMATRLHSISLKLHPALVSSFLELKYSPLATDAETNINSKPYKYPSIVCNKPRLHDAVWPVIPLWVSFKFNLKLHVITIILLTIFKMHMHWRSACHDSQAKSYPGFVQSTSYKSL